MSYGIKHPGHRDPRRVAGNHNDRKGLLGTLVRVRTTYDGVKVAVLAVPSGSVRGVVLFSVDDPFVTLADRKGPYAISRIRSVVVGAPRHFGISKGGKPRSVFDEVRKEPPLLLLRPEHHNRLQAQAIG